MAWTLLLATTACGDSPGTPDGAIDAAIADTVSLDAPPDIDTLDANPSTDSGAADSGAVDASGDAAVGWADPTLSADPDARALAQSYEEQLWAYRDALAEEIAGKFGDRRLTDDDARSRTYSSGWGLAAYHTMNEIIELSHIMEATDDESHRLVYAEMARDALDLSVPAIAEGRGTEGCTSAPTALFSCSPGNFRYLDAGHGIGGAGFVMNALYENPSLRELYASDLERWALALAPVLDRHIGIVDATTYAGAPHMPAKISAGYLAVSKILGESDPELGARYLAAFEKVVRTLLSSSATNTPDGWIGSDVSHARITVSVLHLAFREQLRGVLPTILPSSTLTGVGDAFEAAQVARDYPECFRGSVVGAHGVLVRFSTELASLVDASYTWDRGWECPQETIGALAIGHATALSSTDAR